MPVDADDGSQLETASFISGPATKFCLRSGYESLLDVTDKQHKETSETIVEDNRLKRWHEWLDERKKQHEKLGRILKRTPGYLVMNSGEEFRTLREDRLIFDYTHILAPPDRFRGSPAFFTIPFRLFPDIEAQLTSAERCEIPEIEYVNVPKTLKKYEKNVLGRSEVAKEKWMTTGYRKRRANELAKKIKYIQPHKPDTEDLLIIGTRYLSTNEDVPFEPDLQILYPVLTVSNVDEFDEEPPLSQDLNKFTIESLQITLNDVKLTRGDPDFDVNVRFECYLPPVQITQKIIVLNNSGTAIVRYFWRRITHYDPTLPIKSEKDQFFFDKRPSVILPGQTCHLKFMVRPLHEGMFRETWELITIPNILAPHRIKFNLICHVFEFKRQENFNEICNRIAEKTKNSTVNRIVNYLLHCTMLYHSKHPITRNGKVTEEELFYINNLDPLTQQPKYEYKRQLVQQLRDIYVNETKKDWDYSVASITKMINEKENIDERQSLFAQVNSALSHMTYSSITEPDPEFRKRQLVYNILLWTVNNIVDMAIDLEEKCHIHRISIDQNPELNKSYQRQNLYPQPLPYKSITEPLTKCFQRSDHRNTSREKYRPPLRFSSRASVLETLSPMERHEYLKEMQQETRFKAKQLGLTISEMRTDTTDAGVTFTSTAAPNERFVDFNSFNCALFNEVFYLQVYTLLCKAIDDITAIIDACNLSNLPNLPLVSLEKMLRAECAADVIMKADKPRLVAPNPPSWKTWEEDVLYMQRRSRETPTLVKVADFGVGTSGTRREASVYLKDVTDQHYDGPPKHLDKKIPK